MRLKNKTPSNVGVLQGVTKVIKRSYDTGNNRRFKRKFDHRLLPEPTVYYSQEFPALKITGQWVSVCCCFHEDTRPSLSLNLVSGGFCCFACGAKGGDLVAFHMQRYGLLFVAAVNYFGAWAYE